MSPTADRRDLEVTRNGGAPEGTQLRRRLGIGTDDLTCVGMDTLPYYTHSDIKNDAELCAFFAECGCGHLLRMLEPAAGELREGAAQRTRRHLMMPLPRM